MAGWQEELAELLRELGVTQEEPKTHLRSTRLKQSDVKHRRQAHDLHKQHKQREQHEQSVEAFILEDIAAAAEEHIEPWLTDLDLMRREVDSIVRQVIQLMQRGDLDSSLKEDVMVVLRALRRRAAVSQQAALSDEAYLESAASMLHFCRIVIQLSEAAIEDDL
jgi:DNA-binding TFAR19-related protein (PDSD5 family)